MGVPLMDLKRSHAPIQDEMARAIVKVLEDTQYIMGPRLGSFEKSVAEWLETPHAAGVSNGTDALFLSLLVLKRRFGGGIVLTTPFTFIATAEAIANAGFTVRFVDVDPDTALMDMGKTREAIEPGVVGVVPVHLFGQCVDMDALLGMAKSNGMFVLEDVAQAFGARFKGKRAGSMGEMGAFSFFPSKNLGGAGDGGLITTADEQLYDEVLAGRKHGASPKNRYEHGFLAGNYRLDEMQAALLEVKLRCVEEWNAQRQDIARRYVSLFAQSGLSAREAIVPLGFQEGSTHVFHQYVVKAQKRDGLADHLKKCGVGNAIYYPISLHLQKAFSSLGYRQGAFPNAEALCQNVIALPVFPGLTAQEQEEVVGRIAEFYGTGTK